MGITSYKDLMVWQKAVDLTIAIYEMTEVFPKSEMYGLVSQMRRAAISIPSNIAEGWARQHRPEYLQSLNIAFGSAAELETQLIIAHKLKFVPKELFTRMNNMNTEIMKMLYSLMARLRSHRRQS